MKMMFKLLFKNYWILFLLVVVKMVLQMVVVNPVYELHRDEFLTLIRQITWLPALFRFLLYPHGSPS